MSDQTSPDVVLGTFDVTFAPVSPHRAGDGQHPEDLTLVLDWTCNGGLEPDDRDLVTVQVCPLHRFADEPKDCTAESIVYEVVPYIAGRPDALAVKLDVNFIHLAGPTVADERVLLDWAVDQGMEVSDTHTADVLVGPHGRRETRKAIIVTACPEHLTTDCPGGGCQLEDSVYQVEAVAADWMGG